MGHQQLHIWASPKRLIESEKDFTGLEATKTSKTGHVCFSSKGPVRKPKAPMKYNVGTPVERIALDILGLPPETYNKNKYLLVVVDYFTKWPEAYPIPNQEAITVAYLSFWSTSRDSL